MSSTLTVATRKELLKKLLVTLKKHENDIAAALHLDFKKAPFETFLTEFNYVVSELKHSLANIDRWTSPKRVWPSIMTLPSSDYIYAEPYGKVLIIAPWNYPFQLAFSPLIAAITAGNTVVLKPSEMSFNTALIITKIVEEVFDVKQVVVVHGGPEFTQTLLEKRWDYIFFTGSSTVGKIVAMAAAKHLTPVTLELGGKNPCIIDEGANLEVAAKRIVWGKFVNAGQTCIAPDYIMIHAKEKFDFVELLKKEIRLAYGENPKDSKDFPRIINLSHWKRLVGLIDSERVIFGGDTDENDRYIGPTLIDEPHLSSAIMKDEIFGPILPILTFSNPQKMEPIISAYEKPLALYVFSNRKAFAEKMITQFSFGGGCVNDCMLHFVNKRLPFGGVGHSGLGAYHGAFSFDTFSHKKTIIKRPNWGENAIRFAPYTKKSNFIKKIISWLT